jgi:hypothetical protein
MSPKIMLTEKWKPYKVCTRDFYCEPFFFSGFLHSVLAKISGFLPSHAIQESLGVLPKAEIEERIEKLKLYAPNLAKAHFLRFVEWCGSHS